MTRTDTSPNLRQQVLAAIGGMNDGFTQRAALVADQIEKLLSDPRLEAGVEVQLMDRIGGEDWQSFQYDATVRLGWPEAADVPLVEVVMEMYVQLCEAQERVVGWRQRAGIAGDALDLILRGDVGAADVYLRQLGQSPVNMRTGNAALLYEQLARAVEAEMTKVKISEGEVDEPDTAEPDFPDEVTIVFQYVNDGGDAPGPSLLREVSRFYGPGGVFDPNGGQREISSEHAAQMAARMRPLVGPALRITPTGTPVDERGNPVLSRSGV